MLFKKALIISISIILSCYQAEVAEANSACKNKFSYAAFGSLEKTDLDRLKKKFLSARRSPKYAVPVYLYEVQGILGFSGGQTKTASSGRIEDRIWIDQDNCKRKIKASFMERKLVKIKSYGF